MSVDASPARREAGQTSPPPLTLRRLGEYIWSGPTPLRSRDSEEDWYMIGGFLRAALSTFGQKQTPGVEDAPVSGR